MVTRVLRKGLVTIGINLVVLEVLALLAFGLRLAFREDIYRDVWFDCPSCHQSFYSHVLGWTVILLSE